MLMMIFIEKNKNIKLKRNKHLEIFYEKENIFFSNSEVAELIWHVEVVMRVAAYLSLGIVPADALVFV